MSERDEVQGARSAETKTYHEDRRGFEHRATPQFARAASCSGFPKPLAGDWVVLGIGLALVTVLFVTLWRSEHAAKLRIRTGNTIYATLSLDQERTLEVAGPLGVNRIVIHQGRVRFLSSPCRNQYCVHQGWLSHAGQVAVCLPNQVSLELLGGEKNYDSLNY